MDNTGILMDIPNLAMTNSLLLKMAIEMVDFPITNGDLDHSYVKLPEGMDSFGSG